MLKYLEGCESSEIKNCYPAELLMILELDQADGRLSYYSSRHRASLGQQCLLAQTQLSDASVLSAENIITLIKALSSLLRNCYISTECFIPESYNIITLSNASSSL